MRLGRIHNIFPSPILCNCQGGSYCNGPNILSRRHFPLLDSTGILEPIAVAKPIPTITYEQVLEGGWFLFKLLKIISSSSHFPVYNFCFFAYSAIVIFQLSSMFAIMEFGLFPCLCYLRVPEMAAIVLSCYCVRTKKHHSNKKLQIKILPSPHQFLLAVVAMWKNDKNGV